MPRALSPQTSTPPGRTGRSFQFRNGASSSSSSVPMIIKFGSIGILMIIAAHNLLSQPVTVANNGTGTTSLLEAVPRTLLAEIGEQAGSMWGAATATTSSNNIQQQAAISPGKYPNFDCDKLLRDLKTDPAVQKLDPNINGRINAIRTVTQPDFYIALHNKTFDKTRWDLMTYRFYYETALTKAFQDVLRESPPGARVLDVGGNIGFFSLVSASMGGFTIDTFEPNIKNRMRYCESLRLNRWTNTEFDNPAVLATIAPDQPRTNLYPYGVGPKDGTFLFQENSNPGQGAVILLETSPSAAQQSQFIVGTSTLQIVSLDNFARERGWFETRPHIAIFKVDVEGFEPSVIEGGHELLKSHIIRNIFMEISTRTEAESQINIPMLKFLAGTAGYKLHKIGGWQGPKGNTLTWPNDDDLVNKIIAASKAEGAKQLNLWWKAPEATAQSAS